MASAMMLELADMGSKISALSSKVGSADARLRLMKELKPDAVEAIAKEQEYLDRKTAELNALSSQWEQLKAKVAEKERDSLDIVQPKLPAVERPSFGGDGEQLKTFTRSVEEFMGMFEGRLSAEVKLRQVRAMLTGKPKLGFSTTKWRDPLLPMRN